MKTALEKNDLQGVNSDQLGQRVQLMEVTVFLLLIVLSTGWSV
jgi:hypothetical protein